MYAQARAETRAGRCAASVRRVNAINMLARAIIAIDVVDDLFEKLHDESHRANQRDTKLRG